jgi:large subunit ribosomal protein L25
MENLTLSAKIRTTVGTGHAHSLRRQGLIPAIFYGKGQTNLHLTLDPKALEKVTTTDRGMNAILTLQVEGKGDFNVLLRDYQAHPLKRNFLHADFQWVDLKKKIEVAVPVHLTGKAEGVKEGGILDQVTREIKVFCFPTNIPKEIQVDVSALKIGQNLHLSDVKFPEGVESAEKTNVTVASIVATREEDLTTTAAAGPMAEPEVLTAKKEEGAEGAATGGKEVASGKDVAAGKDAKAEKKTEKKTEKKVEKK